MTVVNQERDMQGVETLLDKAKDSCTPANYSALAARMGVSRQALSRWKNGGEPMPDDRIAQAAHIAKEDGGRWLVTIHAERAHGQAAKDWQSLLRRFGAAAAVAAVVLIPLISTVSYAASSSPMHIMYGRTRALARLFSDTFRRWFPIRSLGMELALQ